MGAMKTSKPSYRAGRTDAARRVRLLGEFERSELSAADFARRHGIHYTTFCGWRARRDKTNPSPAFVQVEVSGVAAPSGLIVELGGRVRMRVESEAQIALAAKLVQQLNPGRPC